MRTPTTALLVGLVGVLGVGGLVGAQPSSGQDLGEPNPLGPVATATVVRTDIIINDEIDGVLGFGTPVPLPNQAQGTVTWLPEVGSIVGFGDVLFELDEKPVILLEGATPAHRALKTGIEDGRDVLQLETALTAAAVADETTLTVDEDFTTATSRAIKRWQGLLEIPKTGRIELGFVVFSPTPLRVSGLLVSLGERATGPALSTTPPTQSVFVELPANTQGLLIAGLRVSVELPDDTLVGGVVSRVAKVARKPQPDSATAVIDIVIDINQRSPVMFDEAPVKVIVSDQAATDILAVPISALLALSEGGFAVEVVSDSGTRVVRVDTGVFGDGLVEVTGDIAEGQTIVMPA